MNTFPFARDAAPPSRSDFFWMAVALWLALATVARAQAPAPEENLDPLAANSSNGVMLLTVVAPAAPSTATPAPRSAQTTAGEEAPGPEGSEHLLCNSVYFTKLPDQIAVNHWLFLTDAPQTEDGKLFVKTAIGSLTGPKGNPKWTIRHYASEEALEAAVTKAKASIAARLKAPAVAPGWNRARPSIPVRRAATPAGPPAALVPVAPRS